MGLLDQFTGLTDDQSQGLLSAGASMLQNSGPSLMPRGLGQIAGGGINAYLAATADAKKRKQEEAQAAQMAQYRALQIQGAQGGLDDRATARQQAQTLAGLQQEYASRAGGGAPPLGGGGAPAMPDMSRMQGGPTLANAATLAQQQAPSASAAQQSPYEQAMGYAQFLQSKGMIQQAMSVAKEAQALKPKFSTEFRQAVGADGKLHNYQVAEDGQIKEVALGVKPDMVATSLGGTTRWDDKNSLAAGQSFAHTQSPDSIASNGIAQQRLAFDRSQVGRPVFNAEAGGFITPPTAAAPGGTLTPLAGMTKKSNMTEDQGKATGWLVQAENAYKNMRAVGVGADGNPTSAAKPGFNDALGAVPLMGGLANSFRTADRQKFIQSTSSLSEALLRAATGAGMNKEEAQQKIQELTPIFGEDEATTKQKFDAIPLYIESLKVRAGPGAAQAQTVLNGASAQPARKSVLKGQVIDGYRFKGGDPADKNNWEAK